MISESEVAGSVAIYHSGYHERPAGSVITDTICRHRIAHSCSVSDLIIVQGDVHKLLSCLRHICTTASQVSARYILSPIHKADLREIFNHSFFHEIHICYCNLNIILLNILEAYQHKLRKRTVPEIFTYLPLGFVENPLSH